jgi:hypothetical protein
MKKIIRYLAIFSVLICLPFFASAVALTPPPGIPQTFPLLFGKIAKGVGALVGGLGTIMFIVSGIMFLFSAGSPERMGKAKTTLIYAIIGIVIGVTAQVIVDAILEIIS